MRSIGYSKMPKQKREENRCVYGAKKLGRGTLGFLGNIGDAFYRKYTELKKEEKKD